MVYTRKNPKRIPPVMMEEHPENYGGFAFVTLVVLQKKSILTIVDNLIEARIRVYVLDLCAPNKVDEELLIELVQDWYDNKKEVPLSVYLSHKGLAPYTQGMLREYALKDVQRIIGPVFKYNVLEPVERQKHKRRLKPSVDAEADIKYNEDYKWTLGRNG